MTRRFFPLTQIVGVLLTGLCVLVPAETLALSQKTIQSMVNGRRPAGLYKLISSADDGVCKPMIASLNKPLVLSSDAMASDFTSDLFLGSDLQVPWQRKPIGTDGILDFAEIDLANNGHPVPVYRWGFFYFEKRFENELFVLPRPSKVWSTADQLPFEATDELYEESIVDLDRHPFVGLHKSIDQLLGFKDRSLAADHFNFNVLSVRGKVFLVLTGANESEGGFEGRPFHVFALSYHADNTVSMVCEFRAGG